MTMRKMITTTINTKITITKIDDNNSGKNDDNDDDDRYGQQW